LAIQDGLKIVIRNFWARLSLRKKLSIAFVMMTLLPIILTTFITWQPYEQAMKNSVAEKNRGLAEQIACDIDSKFAEKIRILKFAVQSEEMISMDPGRQGVVLSSIAAQYPDVQLAVVSNAAGQQISRWDGQSADDNINYLDREYYHTVVATGSTAISGVLVAKSTGNLGIVIAEPIKDHDQTLLGVLIINIELQKLIHYVGEMKIGNTGYAYIVDSKGKIIIHPNLGLIADGMDLSYLTPIMAAISGQNGWVEYDFDNQKRLAGYSYVPSTKWGVIAQQPLGEAMGNVIILKQNSIIIMICACIIAMLIGLTIAGALAKPIANISEATNRLAKGDLAIKIEVMSLDEIGQLANNFNNMTTQLLKRDEALSLAHQELESQVKKRTQELMFANEELQRISFLDGLTDIANRRYFDDFLDKEWQRAKRNNTSLALIMLDVDFFKAYNDTYGHVAGDECLKMVAGILKASTKRATDLVARYGGEEFTLVLPDTDVRGATIVAETVRVNVEQLAIKHKNSLISDNITISVGITVVGAAWDIMPMDIIAAADQALYLAKQKGRNRVEMASMIVRV